MAKPEATQLDAHELELHSTDTDNFPYIKIRGGLYWDAKDESWIKHPGQMVLGTDGDKDADYEIALVANTATQIPAAASVPDYNYVLVLGNRSNTDMVWGNSTTIVVGGVIGMGIPIVSVRGAMNIRMSADKFIYVACAAAKEINYTIFQIRN